jgi:Dyggve-Melchior-Clausen syndrome protein
VYYYYATAQRSSLLLLQIGAYQELLVLLWKLLEANAELTDYVLTSTNCDVTRLLVPICYILVTHRSVKYSF